VSWFRRSSAETAARNQSRLGGARRERRLVGHDDCVSDGSRPGGDEEWEETTSRPGGSYTVEGEIKMYGAFARGLAKDDPRLDDYRRSMRSTGVAVAAMGLAVVVALVLLITLLRRAGY
jgi:hypothetical protein